MTFRDIIIIGPTSSGKSDLANFFATNLNIPIFNCDAIQIYKDLNYLSNKPQFVSQFIENEEVVSFTRSVQFLDFSKYAGFTFRIYWRIDNEKVENREIEGKECLSFLIKEQFLEDKLNQKVDLVKNYLFDIKNPLESYSVSEFKNDINRISAKENFNSKIIAGGTIYYAYHYIAGTEMNDGVKGNEHQVINGDINEVISFLKDNDPGSLKILENKNYVRLSKAVEYIKSTGEKFSENYVKKANLLDNFLLIEIYPKSREEYTKQLNSIVEKRMNPRAFEEIELLLDKYKDIKEWLGQVSYEYRYGVRIFESIKENKDLDFIKTLILELQAKERQYTKRQMSFIRKLEKILSP